MRDPDDDEHDDCSTYYPNGKDLAEKLSKLHAKINESEACEKMGYDYIKHAPD